MERPKKSCSCFSIFSKKIPKKVDQGTDTRQMVRSSLINFSTSVYQSEENQMNNSLSSTQKIQSSLPFYNTLTSPLCRTPSIYQFSNSHIRENSANPNTELKAINEDLPPVRRNSVSFKQNEEFEAVGFDGNVEEKKIPERPRERMMSTESSVVLKFEKGLERKGDVEPVGGKLDGVKGEDEHGAKGGLGELKSSETCSKPDIKSEVSSSKNIDNIELKQNLLEEKKSGLEIIHNIEKNPENFSLNPIPKPNPQENPISSNLDPKPFSSPEFQPKFQESHESNPSSITKPSHSSSLSPLKMHQNLPKVHPVQFSKETPIVSCEIIEELSSKFPKPEEKVKIFPSSPPTHPFISQEEPVIHLKSQNFKVDSSLKKPEEPVFLKIISKSNQNDDVPDIDNEAVSNPFLHENILNAPSSLSPKQSVNINILGDNFLDNNIFIKEAAKKSFENLVNRFSLEKKQVKLSIPGKLSEIQAPSQALLEVPKRNDSKFKNSQEILRELVIKPAGPPLALGQKLNPLSDSYEIEKDFRIKPGRIEKSLSHSKSLSVNNTVIINESRSHSKWLSLMGKDFESSYSGKKIKLVLDSNDLPSNQNFIISPRNAIRRLPSLKISPIKSILSADDYSDILSFLKNSPHCSGMSNKKEPDMNVAKKYKLPALKPITPHYFNKKRSAPQLKQKPRILIEHV